MTEDEEEELQFKLTTLHDRINAIADAEARAALVHGWSANGALYAEKKRLIERSEEIIAELIAGQKNASRT
jgi:hypothetical protein